MNVVSMCLVLLHSEYHSYSHNHNIPPSNHSNRYTYSLLLYTTCFTDRAIYYLIPYVGSTPSPTPSVVITVSITSSGINTAGGIFNIQCSTMISGSTDEPTFTWLSQSQVVDGDGTKTVSPTTVNPNSGYSSTLSFNPLLPSDAGLYTCRVMVGRVTREETIIVTVNGMYNIL